MKYRPLGDTGLEVSEIGFGAWGIGGVADGAVSYGPTDDRDSREALRRAFELGVTFYDTADVYGFGHSEELIGSTLGDVRHRIVIATKAGLLGPYGPQDFSPRHIRTSLETSLRRLCTDYVDLYQLHNPPMELLERQPEILVTLRALQREGKVRAIGASLRSPDDGVIAVRTFGFRVVQTNFNMVDQRAADNGLMAACALEGAGVICRTPLCFGFLTGKYSADSAFDERDHRARWPAEQIALWASAPQVFASAMGDERQTPVQAALRFCLSYPGVGTVIPGMLTRQQVEENAAASALGPLPEDDRRAIEEAYRGREFFLGPAVRPPGGAAR